LQLPSKENTSLIQAPISENKFPGGQNELLQQSPKQVASEVVYCRNSLFYNSIELHQSSS